MVTDGDALWRAVLDNPDDDTPRLIYADWLDENAQPDRAAFIRAQVEAVRAEPFGPKARAAEKLADELLRKNRPEWTRGVRDLVDEYRFERGFVEHVTVGSDRFVRHAESLFEAEPVQSLRVVRP